MFGKKKINPQKINGERWQLDIFNNSEVIDKFNSTSYSISNLLGAYEEGLITLWFQGRYLCTFETTERTFDLLVKIHNLNVCEDTVPLTASEVIKARNSTDFFFVGGDLMTLEHAIRSDEVTFEEKSDCLEVYRDGKKIATFKEETKTQFVDNLKVAQELAKKELGKEGQETLNIIKEKEEKALEEQRKKEELLKFESTGFKHIVLTTESPSPFPVKERMGIVTAEYVHRTKTLESITASIESIGSSRHSTTEGALRKAREEVLLALRREAFLLGADAVVAVDLDYSEITGAGSPLLFLVANGTAIKKA